MSDGRYTAMNDRGWSLEISLRQLRVSADLLIKSYEELHRTGQMSEPELAAAALYEVDGMVTSLAVAGLDRVRYDGSHINELLRRGEEEM